MAHVIRTGRAATCGRAPFLALISVVFGGVSFGQTCIASSSPLFVHQEGLSELVGSINVTCIGGSGGTVNPAVFVALNGNVTNRLDTNGNLTGITVTGTEYKFGATLA